MNILRYVMILWSLLLSSNIFGQSIYAECAGNSLGYYSLNYEHLLKVQQKRVWFLHGGFSTYRPSSLFTRFAVPVGITYFNRPQGNHHREVGLCLGYVKGLYYADQSNGFDGVQYSKSVCLLVNVGYRYQKPEGGLLFKIYYSPTFIIKDFQDPPYYYYRNTFVPFNFGIALGYGF